MKIPFSGGAFHQAFCQCFFTDKFALGQSDARISVAYKNLSVKDTDKTLDEMPPRTPLGKIFLIFFCIVLFL